MPIAIRLSNPGFLPGVFFAGVIGIERQFVSIYRCTGMSQRASCEFHERYLQLASNPPHGSDFQERTLFAKNAVPGGEIGWLFAGHARAIPGR